MRTVVIGSSGSGSEFCLIGRGHGGDIPCISMDAQRMGAPRSCRAQFLDSGIELLVGLISANGNPEAQLSSGSQTGSQARRAGDQVAPAATRFGT